MNKVGTGNRLLMKAVCLALALTFGAGFISAGAMVNPGCGMKCCCQSKPMPRHHTAQEQTRSAGGCCSGSSQMPCDLVAAIVAQLPEAALASAAGHLPTGAGLMVDYSDDLIDRHAFRSHAFDQFWREKFHSSPLYLQNLSFLI